MADIGITKFRVQIPRGGAIPSTPGFAQSEGQDPVNPPGSPTGIYVPYLGATGDVNLGEFGFTTGNLIFDTTPTNIPTTQGTMYWRDSRSTVALIMNGTTQNIGQDNYFYVKNSTGSPIAKGTAVRFAGTDGGSGHILIAPFLANGTYPSAYFMGVTSEAIANGAFGQVQCFGELSGINTNSYTAGALLYASTTVAGGFQTTAPVAPNNIVLVASAINSKNNGDIIIRPQIGSNINNDEGVKIVSPTNGQALVYNSTSQLWENGAVSGSKWTDTTGGIYRNGAVAIGRTTIPTNASFAVQSLTTTANHQFFQLLNNSGSSLLTLTQDGVMSLNSPLARFGNPTVNVAAQGVHIKSNSDLSSSLALRIQNSADTTLVDFASNGTVTLTIPDLRVGTSTSLGGRGPIFQGNVTTDLAIFRVQNSSSQVLFDVNGNGAIVTLSSDLRIGTTSSLGGRGPIFRGTVSTALSIFRILNSSNSNIFDVLGDGTLEIKGNFLLPTAGGVKIGTATNQLLSFWNATPIVQPTTAVASSTRVGGGGTTLTDTDTFDGYTLSQVVKALRNAGLLA